MAVAVGTRIGVYEVTGLLGSGGMGEVYRARDRKLGREVALKILPETFASDPDRLARFEREAQVLASLNHPNIAQIYGLEDAASGGTITRALAMELVEGDTLYDRLARGPIPVGEVLAIAPQIVDALDAAHEQGIVHRDLKPANIKAREDGTVKVLDFGLAKAFGTEAGSRGPGDGRRATTDGGLADTPTITTPAMTQAGVILGTAAYMSPEQARGKTVDKRADVWAFGCVLYEMLTARRAFDGETVTDTLAAIVTREPDLALLPAATPPAVRRLLQKCLEKDSRRRLRDIADARADLSVSAETAGPAVSPGAAAPNASSRWKVALPWAVAALMAVVAVAAVTRPNAGDQTTAEEAYRFTVSVPDGAVADAPGVVRAAASFTVSPDGRTLAMLASAEGGRIWVRSLDALTPRLLSGTEGAVQPFWSADSKRLGFFTQSALKTIDINSGVIQTLTTVSGPRGGTWNRDGVILFSDSRATIQRIQASGGAPQPLPGLPQSDHWWPTFLPDGRRFLFLSASSGGGATPRGINLASLDSAPRHFLTRADSNAAFAEGRLLFVKDNTLFSQALDADAPATLGEPEVLVPNTVFAATTRRAEFSVSETGVLTYVSGALSESQLAWFDRSGGRIGILNAQGHSAIAPDDTRVAADRIDSTNQSRDVWVFDLKLGTQARLTFGPVNNWVPEWSPDGRRIVYTSARDARGVANLYVKDASGTGAEAVLLKTDKNKHHLAWSPDGRFLAYEEAGNVWVLPMTGPSKPEPVLQGPANEGQPAFSPDSRFLAYVSNESGRNEVYVQTFPPTGGRWQISTEGGIQPRWRRDGREMFYLASGGRVMALDVELKGPRFGAPKPLFQTWLGGDAITEHFAVTSDGQRFLLTDQRSGGAEFTVVLNWQRLLSPPATAR